MRAMSLHAVPTPQAYDIPARRDYCCQNSSPSFSYANPEAGMLTKQNRKSGSSDSVILEFVNQQEDSINIALADVGIGVGSTVAEERPMCSLLFQLCKINL